MANRASYGLKKQLNLRYLGRQTKCTLYKTLARPVVTLMLPAKTLIRIGCIHCVSMRPVTRSGTRTRDQGFYKICSVDRVEVYSPP
jgi:hypothetical protein